MSKNVAIAIKFFKKYRIDVYCFKENCEIDSKPFHG